MQLQDNKLIRHTTTDLVFETLHEEIVSLEILPGTKLSETEVARRFGVSRQPVRNAFARLRDLELLIIRPQRATEVRSFSMAGIAHARFVRLAVELEVIRCASRVWNKECEAALAKNLAMQKQAVDSENLRDFHVYDYEFHRLICELSGNPMAFEEIRKTKQKVDRLCVLGLTREREASSVLDDHQQLADALASGDPKAPEKTIRQHLSRLDRAIESVHRTHPDFFE